MVWEVPPSGMLTYFGGVNIHSWGGNIHFGSRPMVLSISAQGKSHTLRIWLRNFNESGGDAFAQFSTGWQLRRLWFGSGSRVQEGSQRNKPVNTTSSTSYVPLSLCGSCPAVKIPRRFGDYILKHGFSQKYCAMTSGVFWR